MFVFDEVPELSVFESHINSAKEHLVFINKMNPEIVEHVILNMFESSPELAVVMMSEHKSIQLDEFIVKHVNSKGEINRRHDRETRKRRATITTGLTKGERRRIARKVVKTKRNNPSIQVKAQRKRKRALRKRKNMGL